MSVRVRAAARFGRHYAAPNVRRYHFSRKRLAEIRRLQSSTHLLLLKAPFDRVVRELIQEHVARELLADPERQIHVCRITDEAKEALREAAEHYLHEIILKTERLTRHRGRVTTTIEDLRLALELSKM
jgi:histone H3/H4